ncbi:hypothetical protein ACEWY4_010069 [Coilia grayii]|uniref:DDE Tnp4 domain-containing protein n=1 Tax=Coilia grayii TaxID=363190 RepID=A0ABD1K870_9TELE
MSLQAFRHDARAFRHTAVATALAEHPQSLVPEGMHIIGDSAYPLLPQLMKPYRDNGHLTAQQRRFNQRLHSVRVVIEHAFGLLKGKFRRLNYLYMARVEDISRAVMACCILHNICIEPADQLNAEDAAVFDAVKHVEPHDNPQVAAYRDDLVIISSCPATSCRKLVEMLIQAHHGFQRSRAPFSMVLKGLQKPRGLAGWLFFIIPGSDSADTVLGSMLDLAGGGGWMAVVIGTARMVVVVDAGRLVMVVDVEAVVDAGGGAACNEVSRGPRIKELTWERTTDKVNTSSNGHDSAHL